MNKNNYKNPGVFPIGEKNDAFAEYFVGQSYLNMLSTSGVVIGNVTFEPGCRNKRMVPDLGRTRAGIKSRRCREYSARG